MQIVRKWALRSTAFIRGISASSTQPTMEYENWTKEELISRLRSLEGKSTMEPAETPRKRKGPRDNFDFSKFPQRKVAFKFSYFGWPYYGLARQGNALGSEEKQKQEDQYPTIEGELFKALAHCKLITGESECDYSRCGRTDRGVSGFGQVVALYVRSVGRFITREEADQLDESQRHLVTCDEFNQGQLVLLPENERELPYVNMLNKLLPQEIRILAWAPVKPDFSARFSCKSRFYRYFFSQDGLDIEAMQQAAAKYLGTHDFRNFCRLDPAKQIKNFERTVLDIAITPVTSQVSFIGEAASTEGKWWQLELHGTAFLWHQVRCMMAILFAVGQKLEPPDIIDQLMDVQTTSGKPEYEMASDLPLVLADCVFDKKDVDWIYVRNPGRDLGSMATLDRSVLKLWSELNTQAVISSALLQNLRDLAVPSGGAGGQESMKPWSECRKQLLDDETVTKSILGAGVIKHSKAYRPILSRKRADPVELRNQAWLERKGGNKRARSDADNAPLG
ncbi:pseudouridine synthase deg1 [Coemansia sp. RSA 989]|nr:pseudouridine synthase deg1 [Coemansia sp. RSA 989]